MKIEQEILQDFKLRSGYEANGGHLACELALLEKFQEIVKSQMRKDSMRLKVDSHYHDILGKGEAFTDPDEAKNFENFCCLFVNQSVVHKMKSLQLSSENTKKIKNISSKTNSNQSKKTYALPSDFSSKPVTNLSNITSIEEKSPSTMIKIEESSDDVVPEIRSPMVSPHTSMISANTSILKREPSIAHRDSSIVNRDASQRTSNNGESSIICRNFSVSNLDFSMVNRDSANPEDFESPNLASEYRRVTVLFIKFHFSYDPLKANKAFSALIKSVQQFDGVTQQFSGTITYFVFM
jgi:hypothetical protein